MKKSIIWIILAVALIGVIVAATLLYNNLSENYPITDEKQDSSLEETQKKPNKVIMNAPDFTVLNEEGEKVNLSDYLGKPIVVNFWTTWCGYCKEEMPDFNRAYKENPDVQFVMVHATAAGGETVEQAKQFVKNAGYEFEIFFDTEYDAVMNYIVTGYPNSFFIDREGNIAAKANGMINYETLINNIELIK